MNEEELGYMESRLNNFCNNAWSMKESEVVNVLGEYAEIMITLNERIKELEARERIRDDIRKSIDETEEATEQYNAGYAKGYDKGFGEGFMAGSEYERKG